MDTTRQSLLGALLSNRRDENAWREFDRVYRDIIRRYAVARGLSANDVEDAVQECMLAVTRYLKSYESRKGRFRAWLRTIVNRKVHDLVAGRKGQAMPLDAEIDKQLQESEMGSSHDSLFDRIFEDGHLDLALNILRTQTNQKRYAAFNLYCLENRKAADVEALLNISRDDLYKIKFALTRRLGTILEELLDEPSMPAR
ncbi:MAG: RNA polymerase sigma factor [Phycisphaerae bacterium]